MTTTLINFKKLVFDLSHGNFKSLVFDDRDDIENKYQEFVDMCSCSRQLHEDRAADAFEDIYGFDPHELKAY